MVKISPIIPSPVYEAIVKTMPQAIVMINERRELMFCNDIFQTLLGLPSDAGVFKKKIEDIIPDKDLKRLINEVQEEGGSREIELLYDREDGEKKVLKVSIKRIPLALAGIKDIILIILDDISEKIMLDVEMIHAEKLEAMMELARCLAHELGNLVHSISSTLQFIKEEKIFKNEDISPDIDFLMDTVKDINNLLASLLQFRNSEKLQFSKEDIHRVINRATALIGREVMRRNIVVDINFSKEVPSFWIDKRQLECLFLNLLKNAIESIPESGRIWVKTSFCPEISEEREGFVIIEIGDTGACIPKEDLRNIFKHCFSTKKGGHGLGLYICQQTVERHNGKITVRSEEGKGSVFTITFPVLYFPPV